VRADPVEQPDTLAPMTTSTAGTHTGRFVWYELLTTDVDAAKAFYTDVIGWKTEPFGPDGYTMWLGGQGPVGGVAALPEAAQAMGASPYWQANVEVTDLDAAIAEVQRAGGKVLVEQDVPTVGRFAVIADPQGAVLALFVPRGNELAPHDTSKPGEFAWHELYTSDHEAGFAFYADLVGWERLGAVDLGPMGTYLLWGRGGKQLGGMMTMKGMKTPDGRDVPASWMYYIAVADFDDAFARAKARGATVLNGPMPVPGGQRVVLMFDPQGAAFALTTPPAA
jgi:uncharacterized protein